jgi:hypothetical protein
MASTRVPSEVKTAVETWQTDRTLEIFSAETTPEWEVIGKLANEGCDAEDIVLLLETLRRAQRFKALKRSREEWLDRANKLVSTLRAAADEAEELLQFIAIHPRTTLSSKRQVLSPDSTSNLEVSPGEDDDDSDPRLNSSEAQVHAQFPVSEAGREIDDGINLEPPERTSYFMGEPDLWEDMRSQAENLESYIKIKSDVEFPPGMFFSRNFVGVGPMLFLLVTAVSLVKEATGQEHYSEITDLIAAIRRADPRAEELSEALDQEAITKRVNRFRERNPEIMEKLLAPGNVRRNVKRWLSGVVNSKDNA